jgi:transposase-like protein
MANEPYKDKAFLYDMYVQRRMNLTDICKHLKDSYNIEVTPQAIYNWVKKYDLLKFRGKGRSLTNAGPKRVKSPAQIEAEKRKRELRKRSEMQKKRMGR